MANILLVEDDFMQADCYVLWLQSCGNSVFHVGSCQQALDCLDQQDIDVILLDMFLPAVNGMQLIHSLQSYPDLSEIPTILLSANLPSDFQELHKYGVQKVVDKTTLSREVICQVVEEATLNAYI